MGTCIQATYVQMQCAQTRLYISDISQKKIYFLACICFNSTVIFSLLYKIYFENVNLFYTVVLSATLSH